MSFKIFNGPSISKLGYLFESANKEPSDNVLKKYNSLPIHLKESIDNHIRAAREDFIIKNPIAF